MNRRILQIFASNTGLLARWITGAIVAAIVAAFARFGFELSAKDSAELSGFIGILAAGVIAEIITSLQSEAIREIQTDLAKVSPEVTPDGHAGEVTKAAVQGITSLVSDLRSDGFTPTPPPTP